MTESANSLTLNNSDGNPNWSSSRMTLNPADWNNFLNTTSDLSQHSKHHPSIITPSSHLNHQSNSPGHRSIQLIILYTISLAYILLHHNQTTFSIQESRRPLKKFNQFIITQMSQGPKLQKQKTSQDQFWCSCFHISIIITSQLKQPTTSTTTTRLTIDTRSNHNSLSWSHLHTRLDDSKQVLNSNLDSKNLEHASARFEVDQDVDSNLNEFELLQQILE